MITTEDPAIDQAIYDFLENNSILRNVVSSINTKEGTKAFIDEVNQSPLLGQALGKYSNGIAPLIDVCALDGKRGEYNHVTKTIALNVNSDDFSTVIDGE